MKETEEFKPTEGKWKINKKPGITNVICFDQEGYSKTCVASLGHLKYNNYQYDAQLIADAGNTYQKTGMLPSEMAEKINEQGERILKFMGKAHIANMESADSENMLKQVRQQNEVLKEALEEAEQYISIPDNPKLQEQVENKITQAISGQLSPTSQRIADLEEALEYIASVGDPSDSSAEFFKIKTKEGRIIHLIQIIENVVRKAEKALSNKESRKKETNQS